MNKLTAALVGLLTGLLALTPNLFAADAVRIGLLAPLTGSWASEGQEMRQVVELLAEEANARGGVLGKQIEIVTEDDGGDPEILDLSTRIPGMVIHTPDALRDALVEANFTIESIERIPGKGHLAIVAQPK